MRLSSISVFFNRHQERLFIMIIGLFSFWLMFSTFGYRDGQFLIDSKLYSDFAAHIPLIRSFSLGHNFPNPEYPFYVGQPIQYHYLFYLLVGWLEKIGLNIALALNVLSFLGFWLLLVMIYKLARLFVDRFWVGVLAIWLFLFNGSLSWVEYFNQHGWTLKSLVDIFYQVQFASFGPWSGRLVSAFWSLNIYTNQRHLGLSYGLTLWLIYLVVKTIRWRDGAALLTAKKQPPTSFKPLANWQQVLVIFGLALFPLLHQAGYVMFGLFFGLWFLIYSQYYWRYRHQTLSYFWPFVVGLGLSLVIFWWGTHPSQTHPAWVVGYLAHSRDILVIFRYWWFNLGFYLILLPVLLVYSVKKRNFLLPISSVYFIIANLVRLSPDMINNHKLINFFMIATNITAAGWLYLKFITKKKIRWFGLNQRRSLQWRRLILVGLVFGLSMGGLVDIWPIINDYTGKVDDYPRLEIARWILNNTPPRSQFLTTSYMYNPASLVGRPLYLDYGYFAWSMGYNDKAKRQDLKLLFAATISKAAWCRLAKKHRLDYILMQPKGNLLEDGRINADISWLATHTLPTYVSNDGWSVWSVDEICFGL